MAKKTEQDSVFSEVAKQMNKQFGDGTVMRLGDACHMVVGQGVSTGSPKLDIALGGKGLPKGRIIELIGGESSSKTTLSLHSLANAQKDGMKGVIIDAEHSLDPAWAENLGVNLDDVEICQPSSGEEGLIVAESFLKAGPPCFIVVDSVAALTPQKELEGDIGDVHVGLQARMMSQALRKLTGIISGTGSIVVFINQIRDKIGGMSFGSNETSPGGRALKFYATCRIDLRRIQTLKSGESPIGIRVKAKVVKNKVAPPFREAEYSLFTEGGISKESDILELSEASGLISKSGSWYSLGDQIIGQGTSQVIDYLKENPDVMSALADKVFSCSARTEQTGAKDD